MNNNCKVSHRQLRLFGQQGHHWQHGQRSGGVSKVETRLQDRHVIENKMSLSSRNLIMQLSTFDSVVVGIIKLTMRMKVPFIVSWLCLFKPDVAPGIMAASKFFTIKLFF